MRGLMLMVYPPHVDDVVVVGFESVRKARDG